MRAVLRYDPGTNEILQVCWTRTEHRPNYVNQSGEVLPNQKEIDSPECVRSILDLSWEEIGDAIKTACELSEDGASLLRKSTGETLSSLVDLES